MPVTTAHAKHTRATEVEHALRGRREGYCGCFIVVVIIMIIAIIVIIRMVATAVAVVITAAMSFATRLVQANGYRSAWRATTKPEHCTT
jgi:hypothetical protein